MPGKKTEIETITNRLYFRDDGIYIDGLEDGVLNVVSDTTAQMKAPAIKISGTSTLKLISPALTLSGAAVTVSAPLGATTVTGDLTRRWTRYISSASAALTPAGYTRCTASTTLPDEGLLYLSGRSGNLLPTLTTTEVPGKTLTMVYTDSGATGTYTAKVSGSSIKCGRGNTTFYYLTFNYPGEGTTLTTDGTSWYPTHPSGMGGPVYSTT